MVAERQLENTSGAWGDKMLIDEEGRDYLKLTQEEVDFLMSTYNVRFVHDRRSGNILEVLGKDPRYGEYTRNISFEDVLNHLLPN